MPLLVVDYKHLYAAAGKGGGKGPKVVKGGGGQSDALAASGITSEAPTALIGTKIIFFSFRASLIHLLNLSAPRLRPHILRRAESDAKE